MPPLPGGIHPIEPLLEFDTTENKFRDELIIDPLKIQQQVSANGGFVSIPDNPGIGVEPDPEFIRKFSIHV